MTLPNDIVGETALIDGAGALVTVSKIEKDLGFKFPTAWRNLLANFSGPIQFQSPVILKKSPLTNEGVRINLILGRNTGNAGIIQANSTYDGRVARKLIPVAESGGGDIIFFDPDNGNVLLWDHECTHGEFSECALSLISESLDELLNSIELDVENTDDSGLASIKLDF